MLIGVGKMNLNFIWKNKQGNIASKILKEKSKWDLPPRYLNIYKTVSY